MRCLQHFHDRPITRCRKRLYGMGCAESRNTVQPQGVGGGSASGAFSVVALGGGASVSGASASASSRLFRRDNNKSGEPKKPPAPKKHKPNALLPEPPASTGSTLSPDSSSSPSAAAIADAKVPPSTGSTPAATLLPTDKPQHLQRLTREELSIEFLKAVKNGDLASMERVAQRAAQPPLVNIRGMWESTPLIYACQYGHAKAALWLLERGANVHLQNEKGVTPLLLASLEGMTDVVDWILAQYASSPASEGAVHVDKQVGVVYNAAADVNARVNPLLAASMNGHVEIVSKLLAQGASVNLAVGVSTAVGSAKQFALLLAAKHGHASVVRILIKHGADFATSDANGNHALLLACEASKEECAMELLRLLPSTRLKAQATSERADSVGGGVPAAEVVQPNAYVACWKQSNCHGLTALHFAAANGLLSVVQSMLVHLQWGCDREFLNATSVNRRECALLMACRKRQSEVVQLLVSCGADFELADRGGTTAFQVLRREKKDELIKLCESRRAQQAAGVAEGSPPPPSAMAGGEEKASGEHATNGMAESAEKRQVGGGAMEQDDTRQPVGAASAPAAAPPQLSASVIDRVASAVGGALRSMSFSHTNGDTLQQQPPLDVASTELLPETSQAGGGDENESVQAASRREMPQGASSASLAAALVIEQECAVERMPLSPEATRGAEPDPTGETVAGTSETAATSTGGEDASQFSPSCPSRKPSRPKHRKKEQPAPPRRPRQKKSVPKDDDSQALGGDAGGADQAVDASYDRSSIDSLSSVPSVPVWSRSAEAGDGGEEPASESRAAARRSELTTALETQASHDVATEDTSTPSPAEDKLVDSEDAPSPKKERRKKKKHHVSKRSKHGASSSPLDAAEGSADQSSTLDGPLSRLQDEDAPASQSLRNEEAEEHDN